MTDRFVLSEEGEYSALDTNSIALLDTAQEAPWVASFWYRPDVQGDYEETRAIAEVVADLLNQYDRAVLQDG